jgi:hypothetical protein
MTLRSFLVDGVLKVYLLTLLCVIGSALRVEYGRLAESTGLIVGCEWADPNHMCHGKGARCTNNRKGARILYPRPRFCQCTRLA